MREEESKGTHYVYMNLAVICETGLMVKDFEGQVKVFDFYFMYNVDLRLEILFFIYSFAEQCFEEHDVFGTLILHC